MKHIFAAAVGTVCFLCAAECMAQAGPFEGEAKKVDLSDPTLIERPPMDPYSISFMPEAPDGAKKDITSAKSCAAAGGKWMIYRKTEDNGLFVGCRIDEKFEGLVYETQAAVDIGNVSPENAVGFYWMIDGMVSGWGVSLHAPENLVRTLTHYKNGRRDGAAFKWDETGTLLEAANYKNDIPDGKYEKYEMCLPIIIGQYKDGNPVGTWELYAEPGQLTVRANFDRPLPKDLHHLYDENDIPKIYWAEWYYKTGAKIIEGYTKINDPSSLNSADHEMYYVGEQQLYAANGIKWLKVFYDDEGKIADKNVIRLCSDENVRHADHVLFDHEGVSIHCMNESFESARTIKFYSNENPGIWYIENFAENNIPDGEHIEYHPPVRNKDDENEDAGLPSNGALLSRYKMHMGRPDGEITFYDAEGNVMGEESHIDSAGNGKWHAYWHNGKLRQEGEFRFGKRTGLWKTWFENGNPESETRYSAGEQNGESRSWFSNGVISEELNYKNGTIDGTIKNYYTDGRIAQTATYEKGSSLGSIVSYFHSGGVDNEIAITPANDNIQTVYYPEGQIRAKGPIIGLFNFGVKHGLWHYYLKDGTVWLTMNYEYDLIDNDESRTCTELGGAYKVDDMNRQMGCAVCGVNRKSPLEPHHYREGSWKWWNEKGKLETVGAYHYGHFDGDWTYYFSNGLPMLKGSYRLDKKTGIWEGFYEDGSKKFSGRYENGVETDIWETYHPGAGISSSGKFANGKRTGKWVYKYPSGALRETGEMKEGRESGTWSQYYEDGKKRGEGLFKDGIREGKWTWWRNDGAAWRTADYVKGRESGKN